jgi:hypothetical protein
MLIVSQAQQIACYPKAGEKAETLLVSILKEMLQMFAHGDSVAWREVLRVFPQFMAVAGEKLIDSDDGRDMALNDPWCALYALHANHEKYSREFESVVLQDGAATYHLLQWSIQTKTKLFLPYPRILKTLLTDPYWAWRWLVQSEDDRLLERMKSFVQSDLLKDPAAAFLWIILGNGRDKEEHWRVAMTQPHTLYYLSFIPEFERYKELIPQQFHLSPKWACHLLISPQLRDAAQPEWRKVLVTQPEWVAEYIVRVGKVAPSEVHSLSLSCRDACRPSYVLNRYANFTHRFHAERGIH